MSRCLEVHHWCSLRSYLIFNRCMKYLPSRIIVCRPTCLLWRGNLLYCCGAPRPATREGKCGVEARMSPKAEQRKLWMTRKCRRLWSGVIMTLRIVIVRTKGYKVFICLFNISVNLQFDFAISQGLLFPDCIKTLQNGCGFHYYHLSRRCSACFTSRSSHYCSTSCDEFCTRPIEGIHQCYNLRWHWMSTR